VEVTAAVGLVPAAPRPAECRFRLARLHYRFGSNFDTSPCTTTAADSTAPRRTRRRCQFRCRSPAGDAVCGSANVGSYVSEVKGNARTSAIALARIWAFDFDFSGRSPNHRHGRALVFAAIAQMRGEQPGLRPPVISAWLAGRRDQDAVPAPFAAGRADGQRIVAGVHGEGSRPFSATAEFAPPRTPGRSDSWVNRVCIYSRGQRDPVAKGVA
jgi:hypothetical protein